MRLNEYQEGYNRKGIVSELNEEKLIAHSIPNLANSKIKNIRTHRIRAALFMFLFWPLIRLAAILFNLMSEKYADIGEKYYTKEIILKEIIAII